MIQMESRGVRQARRQAILERKAGVADRPKSDGRTPDTLECAPGRPDTLTLDIWMSCVHRCVRCVYRLVRKDCAAWHDGSHAQITWQSTSSVNADRPHPAKTGATALIM